MQVAELWRYPVKSMAGERLDETSVGIDGIPGDRRLDVVDSRGEILSARTRPLLLGHRATVARSMSKLSGPGVRCGETSPSPRLSGSRRNDVLPACCVRREPPRQQAARPSVRKSPSTQSGLTLRNATASLGVPLYQRCRSGVDARIDARSSSMATLGRARAVGPRGHQHPSWASPSLSLREDMQHPSGAAEAFSEIETSLCGLMG